MYVFSLETQWSATHRRWVCLPNIREHTATRKKYGTAESSRSFTSSDYIHMTLISFTLARFQTLCWLNDEYYQASFLNFNPRHNTITVSTQVSVSITTDRRCSRLILVTSNLKKEWMVIVPTNIKDKSQVLLAVFLWPAWKGQMLENPEVNTANICLWNKTTMQRKFRLGNIYFFHNWMNKPFSEKNKVPRTVWS